MQSLNGSGEMISYEQARFFILKNLKDEPAYRSGASFRKALLNYGLHDSLPPTVNSRAKGLISPEVLPEVARVTNKRYSEILVSTQPPAADFEAEPQLLPEVDQAIARFAAPVDGETSPFDRIRHVESGGVECWDARELQAVLGYEKWQNFTPIIAKAQQSMDMPGRQLADHFTATSKMVELGSGAQREVESFRLSREACYAIAMEGDGGKPQIQSAKQYFRIQTRRMELTDAGASQADRLDGVSAMTSGMTAAFEEVVSQALEESRNDQAKHNAEAIAILEGVAEGVAELIGTMVQKLRADEARKRNDFLPWQKKRIGKLFYHYTGDGCDLLDDTKIIDKNGNPIAGAVEFDHYDNNRNNRELHNCVPLSISVHARKKNWTADEKAIIQGFLSFVKVQLRKESGSQLSIL